MQGWIKIHRQIVENEFYFAERFTKMQAFLDLLILSNHKPETIFIRGIEINLKPGELCYSQLSLANRWSWNRKSVVKFLNLLKSRNMIDFTGNNITTVITIKNWKNYQKDGQQNYVDNKGSDAVMNSDEGQQLGQQKDNKRDTDKNDKNVKNLFIHFWEEYPRKRNKVDSEKAFLKLVKNEETFNSVMEGLQKFKETKNWKGGYIENPFKWLTRRMWEDEITDNVELHPIQINKIYAVGEYK